MQKIDVNGDLLGKLESNPEKHNLVTFSVSLDNAACLYGQWLLISGMWVRWYGSVMPECRLGDIGHFVVIADSVSIHKCPVLPCMHWFKSGVHCHPSCCFEARVLVELWTHHFLCWTKLHYIVHGLTSIPESTVCPAPTVTKLQFV
jgi:hypothetical protein